MRSFQIQLMAIAIALFAFAAHQGYTMPSQEIEELSEVNSLEDDELLSDEIPRRELTLEEEELANEARAHIAKVMEHNLVRLFAVIAARGQKYGRQEDEVDEEDVAAVTPNPNVLPQVAQILGAIFSGNLNLTRIVDQTFGLVPNVVRRQLMGIVKLLTGENPEELSTTILPETVTQRRRRTTTEQGDFASVQITEDPLSAANNAPNQASAELPYTEGTFAAVELATEIGTAAPIKSEPITSPRPKYRIRPRPPKPTAIDGSELPRIESGSSFSNFSALESFTEVTPIEDDEIEKLVKDLKATARIYEPYVRDKQPRFFIGPFRDIFSRVNFNATEIAKAVPDIFKGARRAFVLLENLGVIPAVEDIFDGEEE